MGLLDIDENGDIVAKAETLMLLPFKAIWDRDKSKGKGIAKKELAFVYYESDLRSTYLSEIDDNERHKNICEDLGFSEKYKVDDVLMKACQFYKSKRSFSEVLLDQLREYSLNTSSYICEQSKHPGDTDIPLDKLTATAFALSTNIEKLDKQALRIGKALDEEEVRGGKDGFSLFEGGIHVGKRH